MPALVLFGRRSRVGSDDLYIPALLVVLYQIPIIFVCVFYTTIWRGCSSVEFNLQGFPFWFMLGAIPIVGFMTCLHIIIMHISTKGSIIEHERRVLMPRVINIHFLWSIVFLTYGTIGVYFWCHGDLCIPDSRFVLATALMMILEVSGSVTFAMCVLGGAPAHKHQHLHLPSSDGNTFDTSERQALLDDIEAERSIPNSDVYVPHQERWEKRCSRCCMCVRCFTCNLFGGADTQHDSMSVVANVFARFFYGSPDLVISDIVAGFILLAAVQAHEESKELLEKNQVMSCEEGTATLADIRMGSIGLHSKIEEAFVSTTSASVTETIGPLSYNSKHPSSPSSPGGYSQSESGYDNDDMKLRESVIELAHFSHYAVGIYGWMLYIWSHPWSGTFRLTFSCFKKSLPYVHGDNLFRLHLTALQLETKLALDDIVYASFVNSICRPAFCVVIDREKKEIVIAVRGTLSLEDCLTDAVAYGVSMDEHAERFGCDGRGEFAHQGFLHAAESLYREINRLGVLDMLFDPNTSVQIVERELNTCEKGAYSDYGLVVCGHSLGAGTAVLLATMLKPKYPRLRCFAFSPPGCIVSHGIARSCSSYVTSVTLGFDIIARTSMQSAEELRDRVIDLIGRSKVGKAAIIKQIVAWKKPHELLHDEDVSLNCPFGLQLANYRTMLQRIQASEPIHEMTIPGKLIHLRRPQVHDGGPGGCWVCCRPGSDGICCTARSNYDFEWSTAESFKSIKISRTMLDDHFPDKVHHVLQDCAKKIQARERRKNSTSSSCL